jgi:glutamate racemase
MPDARPIGFFDSGVGGLTVLREAQARLAGESTIYIGDSARHPYGTRSDEEVRSFAEEIAATLIARGVKGIVVACNTATAVALASLRARHPNVPFIGVVRPGSAAAALATRNGRIGVVATDATVRSGAYFTAIKDENPALHVVERAASVLVPLIERGELDTPQLRDAVAEVLRPFVAAPTGERIDTLLLGCTHFPLIRAVIAEQLGASIAVVDSAAATAATLREVIAVNHLDAPGSTRGTAADAGRTGHEEPPHAVGASTRALYTTGDPAAFAALATRLFGGGVSEVEAISLVTTSR